MDYVQSTGDQHTRRAAREFLWMSLALKAINELRQADPTGNAWTAHYTDGHELRHKSIMAQLGRIGDRDAMLAEAHSIAEQRMPARKAVMLLRLCRRGQAPQASAEQLGSALERAVTDYANTHTGTTPAMVVSAAHALAECYQE